MFFFLNILDFEWCFSDVPFTVYIVQNNHIITKLPQESNDGKVWPVLKVHVHLAVLLYGWVCRWIVFDVGYDI